MDTASPRFRTDLVAQPIDRDGQRFVDVTDPDSGKTFRFYDVEYSIACAMDGRRDVDGLIEWALVELGLETSSDELDNVIATLDDLGYLTDEPIAVLTDEMLSLGDAGGTAEVAPPIAMVSAEPMELGEPGRSPLTQPRPEPPQVPELELGQAGVGLEGVVDVDMPDEPEIEMVAERPNDGVREGVEMSFAGLLDEEEAPTAIRDAGLSGKRKDEADEVPTTVRGLQPPPADFGDLEGLTPPPAEVPAPQLRPRTNPTSDEDGPTNLPPPQVHEFDDEDVSVDLSQHLSIDTESVKEAVRASQVMQAVKVPDDLLAELEESEAAATRAVAEAAAVPAPVVPLGDEVPVGKTPPARVKEAKPVELPDKKPTIKAPIAAASGAAERAAASEERRGVSPVLWLLLILVLVGGAAAYYFLVYQADRDTPANKPAKVAVKPPPEVRQPEVPTARLEIIEAQTATVEMVAEGMLVWIADTGAEVEPGDAVAKLRDFARFEKRLDDNQTREVHYQQKADKIQARLEQAEAAGNQAAVAQLTVELAKHQAKVKEKQEGILAAEKSMRAATLVTPLAGTIEQVGRVRTYLKAGAPVVTVSTRPLLTAVFTLPKDQIGSYTVPADVEVVRKNPAATTTCKVVAIEAPKVTITCLVGGPFGKGDEVTLGKTVEAPPVDEGEPELDDQEEPEIEP